MQLYEIILADPAGSHNAPVKLYVWLLRPDTGEQVGM